MMHTDEAQNLVRETLGGRLEGMPDEHFLDALAGLPRLYQLFLEEAARRGLLLAVAPSTLEAVH